MTKAAALAVKVFINGTMFDWSYGLLLSARRDVQSHARVILRRRGYGYACMRCRAIRVTRPGLCVSCHDLRKLEAA